MYSNNLLDVHSDCELGSRDNDILLTWKHAHVLDISCNYECYIASNHTVILHANSSVGIDTSDDFCKEYSVRELKTQNTVRSQENRGSSVRKPTCILEYNM